MNKEHWFFLGGVAIGFFILPMVIGWVRGSMNGNS